MRLFILICSVFLFSCSSTIYVVRHAEKETGLDPATMKPFANPPLSFEGQQRASKLKEMLGGRDFRHFYSTNTLRTISTANPLKELFLNVPVTIYSSKMDSMDTFIGKVKEIKKGDVLIVGHSNTVDDLVNKLCGEMIVPGDLKDTDYDNLFVVKKKGGKFVCKKEKYGVPSK